MDDVMSSLTQIKLTILTGLVIIASAAAIPITIISIAQAQNATLPPSMDNKTVAIWNMKDKTITLVNPTTNETVAEFTMNPENGTIGDVLTNNTENATTNNTFIPEKTTNESLTSNTENATTNVNLTDKFNTLQGK